MRAGNVMPNRDSEEVAPWGPWLCNFNIFNGEQQFQIPAPTFLFLFNLFLLNQPAPPPPPPLWRLRTPTALSEKFKFLHFLPFLFPFGEEQKLHEFFGLRRLFFPLFFSSFLFLSIFFLSIFSLCPILSLSWGTEKTQKSERGTERS